MCDRCGNHRDLCICDPPTNGDHADGAAHGEGDHPADELAALADGFRPTDVGNANRLVAAADGSIRYVHAWGRWLVYNDGRWIIDSNDALVTEKAKQVPRRLLELAVTLDSKERDATWRHALRSEQSGAITATLRLARGVPGVLVDHDRLDTDPWLLNVRNGTVDLRTGRLRPHDPDDLLTMQAPVIYYPTARAPLWEACVERWQPDPEVRGCLQRAVGSAATGHPVENLFVNIGTGANGKSKFFGAVAHVLGPFAVVPHKSLLVTSRHEGHPTHVASLFRARMLVAPETTQDDRLDEEMIKNLTGGDTLRARRMREDEWAFQPTWTAFMHSNHRPRIRGTDEGIWRRVRLIPWNVTIPPHERDEHLAAKLAAEAPGILNWIIAGALDWHERGLDEPATVLTATDEYRRGEDHLGRFLHDVIDTSDDTRYITAKDLRAAYETWCDDVAESPWKPQGFGRALTERGFDSTRLGSPTVRVWLGMKLR
jgi:putative DNA primase/helicase